MLRTLSSSSPDAVGATKRATGHLWRFPQKVKITPAGCWMAALAVALPISCLGAYA